MNFKNATIDIRFSRESGTGPSGRYVHGVTYTPRSIQILHSGMPVDLIQSGPEVCRLEIRQWTDTIDAKVFFNGQFVYAFKINGIVKPEYTTIRYFHDGFWYILEYRFLNRENS